eukprot:CAMPEP_0178380556 /NCGR_PEP_ID=MMETSP0689_2-20121128/5524_1 /TAXON_ID=160604 /ORGANISM="Amphidinium massartii, Strain CS-259" /LENGTH=728 /DNA_ID=CAMNT_0020000703 /DNA_START=85 /DNA_END=2268 /DNA_ORIENTATION=+
MAAALVADPVLGALNEAWSDVPVTAGYNIVYSIGASSFHIQSSDAGHLSVRPLAVEEVKSALAEAGTHIAIDDEETAYTALLGDGLAAALNSRKMRVEGDGSQLRALVLEMKDSSTPVQAKINAATAAKGIPGLGQLVKPQAAKDRLMLPDGVTSVVVQDDGSPALGPRCLRMWDMLYFSTWNTPFGNVGQCAYNPANIILDRLAWQERQTQVRPFSGTLMWGGVAGIGMRWKAFGSQDMMILEGMSDLMVTVDEAQTVLRVLLTRLQDGPEWIAAAPVDEATRAFVLSDFPKAGDGPAFMAESYRWAWDSRLEHFVWKQADKPELDKEPVDPVSQELDGESQACARVRAAREQWLRARAGESAQEEEKAVADYQSCLREVETWSAKNSRRLGSPVLDICKEARQEMDAILECPFVIGGSWDDWQVHDLSTWSVTEDCYTLEIELGPKGAEQFQVQPGRSKRWRQVISMPNFMRKWSLQGAPGDRFRVRVYAAMDGAVEKVTTEMVKPKAPVAAAKDEDVSQQKASGSARAEGVESGNMVSSNIGLDKAISLSHPGMKEKARMAMIEKLAQVEIYSLLELSWSLESSGAEDLDAKLRQAGEKDFSIRSIRKLCEEVCKQLCPPESSSPSGNDASENATPAAETSQRASGTPAAGSANGNVQVVVRNLTRGGSIAVSVAPTATVLEVRKAVMAEVGETNIAKVKIVEKLDRGTKMIADSERLGDRRELS